LSPSWVASSGVVVSATKSWTNRSNSSVVGGPGVPALLAEDLDDEVGGAVHHLRLVAETGRRIDEAGELHHPLDAVEITERCLGLGEDVDGAKPGGCPTILDPELGAEDADEFEAARTDRNLARNVQHAPTEDIGNVVCRRRRRRRQDDPKGLEAADDMAGHGWLPLAGRQAFRAISARLQARNPCATPPPALKDMARNLNCWLTENCLHRDRVIRTTMECV